MALRCSTRLGLWSLSTHRTCIMNASHSYHALCCMCISCVLQCKLVCTHFALVASSPAAECLNPQICMVTSDLAADRSAPDTTASSGMPDSKEGSLRTQIVRPPDVMPQRPNVPAANAHTPREASADRLSSSPVQGPTSLYSSDYTEVPSGQSGRPPKILLRAPRPSAPFVSCHSSVNAHICKHLSARRLWSQAVCFCNAHASAAYSRLG